MQHMKPVIVDHFKNTGENIFSLKDIEKILTENKENWRLAKVTRTEDMIKFLTDKGVLEEIVYHLPQKDIKKYKIENISTYKIVSCVHDRAYMSHYSAVFLYGLTDNIPKNFYVNIEQSVKPKFLNRDDLIQHNIDKAFKKPIRKTNKIAQYKDHKIFLLNGKFLNRLEVIPYGDEKIPITSMERTLIDIAIRPIYAGGVHEVMNAYKAAIGRISVNRLLSVLKKMDYIYPYHQTIGFYLEKAGYKEEVVRLCEKLGIKYNFYLTYEMKEKEYSERWKLFYPKGF